MKLHLGVTDLPYPNDKDGISTGDVAEILEENYEVMATYWEKHGQEGADALTEALVGTMESQLMGAPPTQDPFGSGTEKIEDGFRKFLDAKEMDGRPGVPTQAAKDGVSHRFKRPYVKRDPRPSFIDTGLYQANMKAWVD